jgi:hypothetical protein
VRDDRRVAVQRIVTAGVIEVVMGIDDEAQRLVRDALERCAILSARGAYWSSTIAIPSSPTETPMLPPAPSSM